MSRQLEFQIGSGAWAPIGGAFDRYLPQLKWSPPVSGNYRFRSRIVGVAGDVTEWVYSEVVRVRLRQPPIIEELNGACPDPLVGTEGQLWLSDGIVWRRGPDPWSNQGRPGVGVSVTGRNGEGFVYGAEISTTWFPATQTALINLPARSQSGTPPPPMPRRLVEMPPAYGFHFVYDRDAGDTGEFEFRMGASMDSHAARRDFKSEFENDLVWVFLDKDTGDVYFTHMRDDASEPYTWPADTGAMAFFGKTRANISIRLMRWSIRCQANPANPWFIDHALTTGGDSRELERAFVLTGQAINAPTVTPSNTAAYDSYPAPPAQPLANVIYDDFPGVSNTLRAAWVTFRQVTGQPEAGDAKDDDWSDWTAWRLFSNFADTLTEEVIYGAYTDETLASNQRPLNSWTLGQVGATGATGITRNGVKWASTLSAADFGQANEYGFRATRKYDDGQATGTAVADEWDVQRFSHYATTPEGARVSRRQYDHMVAASGAGDGRYRFYTGATGLTGGTAVTTWKSIITANKLVIDRLDRRGWPNLVLDRIQIDQRITFEPKSSQWATWTVSDIEHGTNQTTLALEPVTDEGSTGGPNPPTTPNVVDFYFEALPPPRPPTRGAAQYSASYRNRLSTDPTLTPTRRRGWFAFYNSTTISTDTDIVAFDDTIKNAVVLRMFGQDEHGNLFDSLDALVEGNHIVATLLGRDDIWAAWEVVGAVTKDAFDFYQIGLKLVGYNVDRYARDASKRTYETVQDVEFAVSPYVAPSAETLGIRVESIADVDEGTTTIPFSAIASGTALEEGTSGFVASAILVVTSGTGDPMRFTSGSATGSYRVSVDPIPASSTGAVRITGSITAPASISADARCILTVRLWDSEGHAASSDNEFFLHKNVADPSISLAFSSNIARIGSSATLTATASDLPAGTSSMTIERRRVAAAGQPPGAWQNVAGPSAAKSLSYRWWGRGTEVGAWEVRASVTVGSRTWRTAEAGYPQFHVIGNLAVAVTSSRGFKIRLGQTTVTATWTGGIGLFTGVLQRQNSQGNWADILTLRATQARSWALGRLPPPPTGDSPRVEMVRYRVNITDGRDGTTARAAFTITRTNS